MTFSEKKQLLKERYLNLEIKEKQEWKKDSWIKRVELVFKTDDYIQIIKELERVYGIPSRTLRVLGDLIGFSTGEKKEELEIQYEELKKESYNRVNKRIEETIKWFEAL